jgi:hypothetical protein
MKTPGLTIFGIKETEANKNKFVPHYYVLHKKLYPTSRLYHMTPRSVMQTTSALQDIDYWTLDNDFFYFEDSVSLTGLLNSNASAFTYFSDFLKVYRIAHGLFDEPMLSSNWTKNKAHIIDIYTSMMVSDVLLISPTLEHKLDTLLPELFSDKLIANLKHKMLILPQPDSYKFEPLTKKELKTKDWSKLKFVWNHRLNANKDPKTFFTLILEFHTQYPKVPLEIIVMSDLKNQAVLEYVPEQLRHYVKIEPFHYDSTKYRKVLDRANITIACSIQENYSNSVLDSVKRGVCVIAVNNKNKTFAQQIGGTKTTFNKDTVGSVIHKLWTSESYRSKFIQYQLNGLSDTAPSSSEYTKLLTSRLKQVLDIRLDKTPATSKKLAEVMKTLRKKPLSKREVYAIMGWKSTGAIINNFWPTYYYGLRKLGANTVQHNGELYYYSDELTNFNLNLLPAKQPEQSSVKNRTKIKERGLFK